MKPRPLDVAYRDRRPPGDEPADAAQWRRFTVACLLGLWGAYAVSAGVAVIAGVALVPHVVRAAAMGSSAVGFAGLDFRVSQLFAAGLGLVVAAATYALTRGSVERPARRALRWAADGALASGVAVFLPLSPGLLVLAMVALAWPAMHGLMGAWRVWRQRPPASVGASA